MCCRRNLTRLTDRSDCRTRCSLCRCNHHCCRSGRRCCIETSSFTFFQVNTSLLLANVHFGLMKFASIILIIVLHNYNTILLHSVNPIPIILLHTLLGGMRRVERRVVERRAVERREGRVLCRSAWVGHSSPSVCLFVCLFVCPQHNSKTKHSKVFKLGVGNDLVII